MLEIVPTTRFKRDLKRCGKQGKEIDKIEWIVNEIQQLNELPISNKDHPLTGNWSGFRECHIEPDWLLIYHVDKDKNLLHLTRTGSHANLFDQ
ncbi:MAG: type II toxin-antitoxin system YafQ family toxin [Methylococcales bacterium]